MLCQHSSHDASTYYTRSRDLTPPVNTCCSLNVFLFPNNGRDRTNPRYTEVHSRNMTTTACRKTAGALPLLSPLVLLVLILSHQQTMVAAFHVVHQHFRAVSAPSSAFTSTDGGSSSHLLGGRPARAETEVSMGFSLFSFGQKKASRSLCKYIYLSIIEAVLQ